MAAKRNLAGSVRELAVLGAGLAMTTVGLMSKPREPEIISIGIGLLVATPAAGGSSKEEEKK